MSTSSYEDWKPQSKQQIALSRLEKEVLYGGARGGGKTECGLAFPLYNTDKEYYRALVVRKNADDLRDWIDRAEIFYKRVGAIVMGNPKEVRFPSGAIIRTGHLKDANAYRKYQGHEYQNILIEELTHIARESDYEALIGSCRSTHPDIPAQVFSTTNPDGPGHDWVKERFRIDDIKAMTPFYDKAGNSRIYIPSTIDDNPILMQADPGYVKYLESITDDDLREAWRSGSWSGFGVQGAIYGKEILKAIQENRITTVAYDKALPVFTVWDLGIDDSMCIIFFQIFGNTIRIIDYYENNGEGLLHYKRILIEKGYNYSKHFAPHDIKVRELTTGKSRFETAARLGIKFDLVPKLGLQDGIEASRAILSRCWFDKDKADYLIKCLKNYRKVKNEKLLVFGEPLHDWASHGSDAFRYLSLVCDKMTAKVNYSVKGGIDVYKGV